MYYLNIDMRHVVDGIRAFGVLFVMSAFLSTRGTKLPWRGKFLSRLLLLVGIFMTTLGQLFDGYLRFFS